MMRIPGLALALAMAASPIALEAQVAGEGTRQERAVRPAGMPSIAMLLQQRADLDLTAEQVSRLEAIQQELVERNAPLMEQLRFHEAFKRGEGARHFEPGQRAQLRQRMENLTPEQREAMRQRMENLTPEQREAMRQRMENMRPEQREAMRQRMREHRQAGEGQPRMRGSATPLPEELRPVARQLQENTRSALAEARGVLTAEQQAKLREFAQQQRSEWRSRAGATGGQRGVR